MAISEKSLRAAEALMLGIAALVTIIIMLSAADSGIGLGHLLFTLWAISPYIGLAAGDFGIRRIAIIPQMAAIFCAAAFVLFGITLYAYLSTLGSRSSTYGLVFLFIPLYLNVGVVLVVGGSLVWALVLRSVRK